MILCAVRARGVIAFSVAVALTAPWPAALAQDHAHAAGAGIAHTHDEMLMVPADRVPRIAFAMNPDLTGGWHLAIETENFEFAPQNADREHVLGEGHAHLYVNGHKVSRIYGADYYLGPLSGGPHLVEVTLNTNDHQVYATENGHVATARYVVLAPPEGELFPEVTTTIDATLVDGNLTGLDETVVVPFGEGIAINWQSDTAIELHLHGYDLEATVSPMQRSTMLFVSNIPGRFAVESHGVGGEHAVLFIEVRP